MMKVYCSPAYFFEPFGLPGFPFYGFGGSSYYFEVEGLVALLISIALSADCGFGLGLKGILDEDYELLGEVSKAVFIVISFIYQVLLKTRGVNSKINSSKDSSTVPSRSKR